MEQEKLEKIRKLSEQTGQPLGYLLFRKKAKELYERNNTIESLSHGIDYEEVKPLELPEKE